MAHAEICPVCCGRGRSDFKEEKSGTTIHKSQPCHGCNGRGWVEVSDTPAIWSVWEQDLVKYPVKYIYDAK